MGILALAADERLRDVRFTEDTISVDLMDGRTITVPLAWYPRLYNATKKQREFLQRLGLGDLLREKILEKANAFYYD